MTFHPLDGEWAAMLDGMRAWVAASVSGPGGDLDLADDGVRLSVVEALLRDGIGADETVKLQALGVVLGDVLASILGVPWVVVHDEWGATPGLAVAPGAALYPVTMVSKRVEEGRDVDVRFLVQQAAEHAVALGGATPDVS
ncbi:DUF3806 domain-containing protein [Litorihabitans aurantiacus]|uniref:DUF3806 domain-containing protein n=1 Tax=Litorihabitans aurantiacus TaxID=1930061 RepID=A0AA37XGH9_9MICO|nr:DUF3806 domain-containing protein [Litorihabitans aurantiacus]GMA32881.1 hypothetical protein GCM10025875_28730 [Litorihabitans aurantiacus]